jgi:predicted transcriptional regulator
MWSSTEPVPSLHALEATAMEAMWELREASVREVMDEVNRSAAKPRAYTTYMTILGRLHAKGLLTRHREGKTDRYAPVCSREDYNDLRVGAEVEALIDAFGDVALSHFARQVAELGPDRRRALEQLSRAHH